MDMLKLPHCPKYQLYLIVLSKYLMKYDFVSIKIIIFASLNQTLTDGKIRIHNDSTGLLGFRDR